MPRIVAQRVRNWAIANKTLAVMSCSDEISREVKERATAVANDAMAMPFSM